MSRVASLPADWHEARRAREIESHRTYLLSIARHAGPPLGGATASDLVQDALMAATVADRAGRGPGPTDTDLRLWLRTILANKVREAIRREKARIRGGGLGRVPLPADVPDDGTSPSQGAINNEERERLDEALRSLSKQDLRLVVWSLHEGRSRKEIGDRLGVSASYASRICALAEGRLYEAYRATRRDENPTS